MKDNLIAGRQVVMATDEFHVRKIIYCQIHYNKRVCSGSTITSLTDYNNTSTLCNPSNCFYIIIPAHTHTHWLIPSLSFTKIKPMSNVVTDIWNIVCTICIRWKHTTWDKNRRKKLQQACKILGFLSQYLTKLHMKQKEQINKKSRHIFSVGLNHFCFNWLVLSLIFFSF